LVQARAKTKGSQRTIALTTATVEALKRQRDRQTFQRQAAGEAWANLDLIVCDELGGPIRPDSVDRHRDAVIAEAGVPPLTTHQLRHGAAARMLKAGVPIAVVAEKLGHQDVSLTYSTYGHLSHEDQTAANDAITAFLARAGTTG
jgi:integrase